MISSLRSIVFDSCSSVSQFFSFLVACSELVMFKEAGGPFQFFVFGDLFCQLSCWTMLLLFTSLEIVLGKIKLNILLMIIVTQVFLKEDSGHESDYFLAFMMLEVHASCLSSVFSCYNLS